MNVLHYLSGADCSFIIFTHDTGLFAKLFLALLMAPARASLANCSKQAIPPGQLTGSGRGRDSLIAEEIVIPDPSEEHSDLFGAGFVQDRCIRDCSGTVWRM